MSVLGLSVEFRIDGQDAPDGMARLAVAFERGGAELLNIGEYAFPKLLKLLEATEAQQFDEEGAGPRGGSWAPLSAQYARWKERAFPGRRILEREGKLRAALTSSGSPFARREISADTFVYGSAGVPYATFHQLGTARMPARPVVDLGDDFEADLQLVGREAVREALQHADEVFAREAL